MHIELSLWDTAGQEEYDRLRSLSYDDDTHTIMLCFSVDSRDSLENVESKWVGEIEENCAGVNLVLVALKCDLRETSADDEAEGDAKAAANSAGLAELGKPNEKTLIDYNTGLELAKRIKALRYLGNCSSTSDQSCLLVECSAKRNRGVNEAFTEAARVALSAKSKGASSSKRSCTLM